MRHQLAVVAAMLLLALGTFAFRLAGPVLRTRIALPARAGRLLETGAVVLLAGLVATTALTTDHSFALPGQPGWRSAGCWPGAGHRSSWWCSLPRPPRRSCACCRCDLPVNSPGSPASRGTVAGDRFRRRQA
ncbi:MAG TPA: AzlD domain-containing protein [Streptosporangiaceae bacterium]|nr:AzlD domain-containing protein [Streptosporangiaceae bacterium]